MSKERKNIQDLWVIGINYKNTDTTVRGLFAVNPEQYDKLIAAAPQYGISDFFILSTCNRTEIYGFADNAARLVKFLCSVSSADMAIFDAAAYKLNGDEALGHLYRVATGLDSQILGDFEILGQLKTAVKHAKSKGCLSTFMERLMNSVLRASKSVKTNTVLSGGTVSVAFAAVQCIRNHYQHMARIAEMLSDVEMPEDCKKHAARLKILVLGTGKIGRTTCQNLVDYIGPSNITLINRTEQKAIDLATELKLRWAPISVLQEELHKADIILVSTSSPEPLILKKHLEGSGDKLVIDISVPCNVDAEAQKLPNITFINVDELSKIKDETLQKRKDEVPAAVAIVNEHIAEFKEWDSVRNRMPVLNEVKIKLKEIYIHPSLLNSKMHSSVEQQDEKIQKVINSLAIKMRSKNTAGCNFIEAINDFIR
jgi:glutamyl-tRNA reductase